MLVKDLHEVVKLGARVANDYSLAPISRSIMVGKSSIRVYSEHGNLAVATEDSGLTAACWVEAKPLEAILNSLPDKSEIVLENTGAALKWKCGKAKGDLAIVPTNGEIPFPEHENFPWIATKELGVAFELAAIACQAATVSLGIYGISIGSTEDGKVRLASSNSNSLAETQIVCNYILPNSGITVRPPVPAILSNIIQREENLALDINENGIFCLSDNLVGQFPLSQRLTKNLFEIADQFPTSAVKVKIDGDTVRKFLNRATALVDKHATNIVLGIENGAIKLEHKGAAASSEEYFLAEGLNAQQNFEGVTLPISLMAAALRGVDTAVLDYLSQKVLILEGSNPQFRYFISGQ